MLYTYSCEDCLKQFEIQKPLAESEDPVPCPYCEKDMQKVITPVPFRIN